MSEYQTVSYRTILHKAWPIILANAAVPLLGLVDTAVIGHYGTTAELAALAIASLVFSFIYWGFGFLRMGTTGFVARAEGRGDSSSIMRVILQSSVLALSFALLLVLTQTFLLYLALTLLAPPESVHGGVTDYFTLRIWAAPATLLTYVMNGVFIGRGQSRNILILQLVLNGSNALLDVLFAGVLGWGIKGIALGTCIAEYLSVAVAMALLIRGYAWRAYISNLVRDSGIFSLFNNMSALLSQNTDIFIRTLFLLLSFSFFTHISGQYGENTLAANHILLQLVAFSAFFLDAFAFVLESYAGKAFGKKSLALLDIALWRSSVVAFITAAGLAWLIYVFGDSIVAMLSNKPEVHVIAEQYLAYAAIYVLLAVAAFQLDGLFIGVAYGRALRDASVAASVLFIVSWYGFFKAYALVGLWLAMISYVVLRALALFIFLPRLRENCTSSEAQLP